MSNILYADLILANGKIITMDKVDSLTESVAVKNGKILALGPSEELSLLAGPETKVIDLNGKTVMPGIIDSHTHPSHIASRFLEIDCRSPPVKNISEILGKIEERSMKLTPGEWIRGANFNDSKLREKRHITREELDGVSPENPVFIVADTGHQAIVNSVAFKVAGIDEGTPNPPGGEIEKDFEGKLTGLLYENAIELVHRYVPEYSIEELKESYRKVVAQFSEWGITTTHNASSHRNGIRAYKQLIDEGTRQLRMRLMMSVNRERQGDVLDALETAGIESGFGDDWLQVMSVKIMGDGSGAGGTCCVYEPQNRGPKGLGLWITEPEQMEKLVIKSHKAGLRVSIHSIGDRGIDVALDCIEKAQKDYPRNDMRHRIEHNSLCTPLQLKRIRELGVTPSSSIGYMYGLGEQYVENFGLERSRWLHPHKTMKEMGIVAGGNNDCPVTYYSPFVQIYEAVTRKTVNGNVIGPEESISILDAIKVYTWNGAFLGKDEGKLGSIEPGKLADMIILDRDILEIPSNEIKDVKVLTTIVDGKIVYAKK